MQYDVVGLTLPIAMAAWRYLRSVNTPTRATIFLSLILVVANPFAIQYLGSCKLTESGLLLPSSRPVAGPYGSRLAHHRFQPKVRGVVLKLPPIGATNRSLWLVSARVTRAGKVRFMTVLLWVAAGSCGGWAQDISSASSISQNVQDPSRSASSLNPAIAISSETVPTSLVGGAGLRQDADQKADSSTRLKASTNIPLDSWIYPVFDRLAALGYMPDSTAMIRPWTRLEGARLVAEAHEHYFEMDDVGESLLASLDEEFIRETQVIAGAKNDEAGVESVYARYTGIDGTALRDGYHFSQTLVNDFGRPYGQGTNGISGIAAREDAGPFALYFRGEYQYASALPLQMYTPTVQQALVYADVLPFGWNLRFGDTSRLRPVEAYATLDVYNWQLTAGQQSLWWGPDRSTSLILSTNAAPLPMLRIDRLKPGFLPGRLRLLGPIHFDFFLARQGGIHYVALGPTFIPYGTPGKALTPPPYLWGVHLTIKPTPNFELGLAHTVIFAGYGRPLTLGTFLHSFSIFGNGQPVDPGKRVTEVNLDYHIPWFRRAIQVYSEGMAWDDPIEGKFVARFAWDPGVYVSELPKFHKLDARFEAVYTDLPKGYYQGYYYANTHYPQGYTNYGQILGSWVGRQGIGGQASSTYWASPKKKISVFYRKMVSDPSIFEGGSNSDYGATASWRIRSEIEVNALGQYERWKFPFLEQTPRSNFTGSIELRVYPALGFHPNQGR